MTRHSELLSLLFNQGFQDGDKSSVRTLDLTPPPAFYGAAQVKLQGRPSDTGFCAADQTLP